MRNRPSRIGHNRLMVGKGDDAGRYYRCRKCGFVVDSNKVTEGDSGFSSSVSIKNFAEQLVNPITDSMTGLYLGVPDGTLTLMRYENDSAPQHMIYPSYAQPVRGCRFCGATHNR